MNLTTLHFLHHLHPFGNTELSLSLSLSLSLVCTMSDYFPRDVLFDILSRVPSKSLLKLRSVCKSWNAIITSPNFINTHLNQSNKNPNFFIKHFSAVTKKEVYSLRSDEPDSLDSLVELKCPFRTRNRTFFRVVGSCNGLICLSDDQFGYTCKTLIWNPSIRKFLDLPTPRVCFDVYGPYMFALGFGFDPLTDDYKVVRIAYLQNKMGSWDTSAGPESLLWGGKDGYIVPPEVEIFSLRTGSWKTIEAGVPLCNVIEFYWSSVFLNGAVHWIAYYKGNDEDPNFNFRNVIMVFDVGSEIFHEINLPKRLAREYPLNLSIGLFGDETISVFQYDERAMSNCCSVWVMRKYGVDESWKLQFNVSFGDIGIATALGFRKNGELLLAKLGGEVVSYDSRTKGVKSVGIRGGRDSVFVGVYAESLVLLDNVNGIGTLGMEAEVCDTSASEEEENDPFLSGPDEEAVLFSLEKHALMHFIFAATFLGH